MRKSLINPGVLLCFAIGFEGCAPRTEGVTVLESASGTGAVTSMMTYKKGALFYEWPTSTKPAVVPSISHFWLKAPDENSPSWQNGFLLITRGFSTQKSLSKSEIGIRLSPHMSGITLAAFNGPTAHMPALELSPGRCLSVDFSGVNVQLVVRECEVEPDSSSPPMDRTPAVITKIRFDLVFASSTTETPLLGVR